MRVGGSFSKRSGHRPAASARNGLGSCVALCVCLCSQIGGQTWNLAMTADLSSFHMACSRLQLPTYLCKQGLTGLSGAGSWIQVFSASRSRTHPSVGTLPDDMHLCLQVELHGQILAPQQQLGQQHIVLLCTWHVLACGMPTSSHLLSGGHRNCTVTLPSSLMCSDAWDNTCRLFQCPDLGRSMAEPGRGVAGTCCQWPGWWTRAEPQTPKPKP